MNVRHRFLLLFLCSGLLQAMEQSEFYYLPQHLEQLEKRGIQKALPLYVVIDNEQIEDALAGKQHSTALTHAVWKALSTGLFPVLVSDSVLINLLHYQNDSTWAEIQKKTDFDERFLLSKQFSEIWEVYKFDDESASLLIPKRFHLFYESALNLNKPHFAHNISYLLPAKGEVTDTRFDRLTSFLEEKIKGNHIAHMGRIFKSLFKIPAKGQDFPARWNIILDGHGTSNPMYEFGGAVPMIAGLSIKEINEVLSILDKQAATSLVYIVSCYSGGTNLKFLQVDQAGMHINHNYVLIVGSSTDAPTTSMFTPAFFVDFFNLAAQFQDKGKSLNQLLHLLVPHEPNKPDAIKRVYLYSIPQVWLPGGLGFTSFNIDKEVSVIGNVTAKVHGDEKKPICIENKQAVLLYPQEIQVPLIFKTDKSFFPSVISMIHGDSVQFIREISMSEPYADLLTKKGVAEGLYDIFLRTPAVRGVAKTFLIQKMSGLSDFGAPFENEGTASLSNIMVAYTGFGKGSIKFELNGKAWHVKNSAFKVFENIKKGGIAEVREINKETYQQEYAAALARITRNEVTQKSISESLKKRQQATFAKK